MSSFPNQFNTLALRGEAESFFGLGQTEECYDEATIDLIVLRNLLHHDSGLYSAILQLGTFVCMYICMFVGLLKEALLVQLTICNSRPSFFLWQVFFYSLQALVNHGKYQKESRCCDIAVHGFMVFNVTNDWLRSQHII